MLLTLTTTRAPATDLGWLLHKHPARTQTFELAFGRANVFYPEASDARCTAALLLDVDPIGLVRRGGAGFALQRCAKRSTWARERSWCCVATRASRDGASAWPIRARVLSTRARGDGSLMTVTDWVFLDCELMPWSAKAKALLQEALSEFALGVEALERFVRGEPLRRTHECVIGVLAQASEPIDPRL